MMLSEFLAARLGEDEAAAQTAAAKHLWDRLRPEPGLTRDHHDLTGWLDPARRLREAEAKRAILALHVPMWPDDPDSSTCARCGLAWPCATLRALAAIWSGHPDHRQEWKR